MPYELSDSSDSMDVAYFRNDDRDTIPLDTIIDLGALLFGPEDSLNKIFDTITHEYNTCKEAFLKSYKQEYHWDHITNALFTRTLRLGGEEKTLQKILIEDSQRLTGVIEYLANGIFKNYAGLVMALLQYDAMLEKQETGYTKKHAIEPPITAMRNRFNKLLIDARTMLLCSPLFRMLIPNPNDIFCTNFLAYLRTSIEPAQEHIMQEHIKASILINCEHIAAEHAIVFCDAACSILQHNNSLLAPSTPICLRALLASTCMNLINKIIMINHHTENILQLSPSTIQTHNHAIQQFHTNITQCLPIKSFLKKYFIHNEPLTEEHCSIIDQYDQIMQDFLYSEGKQITYFTNIFEEKMNGCKKLLATISA